MRGRDQTPDFSWAVLVFRSQLNGTRIIFIIVAVTIIVINYGSYPWFYESIKNIGPFMLDPACKHARFWPEVSSAALSGLCTLCFVQSTTCSQPSTKGGGPSGPHPCTPQPLLQHRCHWRSLGPELLDLALLSFTDSFFLDTGLCH